MRSHALSNFSSRSLKLDETVIVNSRCHFEISDSAVIFVPVDVDPWIVFAASHPYQMRSRLVGQLGRNIQIIQSHRWNIRESFIGDLRVCLNQ